MNLPNLLTLSRFGFALILVILLLQNSLIANVIAVFVFIIAALTDFYDGYLAKKRGLITNFGKIMDPIADKVLILSLFFVLAYLGATDMRMVMLIALREIVVTVSRLVAMKKGQVIAAESLGKIKTVVQIVAVSLMLLYLVAEQSAICVSWFYVVDIPWRTLNNLIMLSAVVITLISGISYFQSKRKAGL
jgi:CDP-diacylglycerol--glycerol-3-phosphate 3-phosphatidyltransferase